MSDVRGGIPITIELVPACMEYGVSAGEEWRSDQEAEEVAVEEAVSIQEMRSL